MSFKTRRKNIIFSTALVLSVAVLATFLITAMQGYNEFLSTEATKHVGMNRFVHENASLAAFTNTAQPTAGTDTSQPLYIRETFSGAYLSSLFAQRRHNWHKAHKYIKTALEKSRGLSSANYHDLLKRGMVLAAGSGYYQKAFEWARILNKQNDAKIEKGSLGLLFLAVEAFKENNFEQAESYISRMPNGTITNFVMPILKSWAAASKGKLEIDTLNRTAFHRYHAVLIADYLGQQSKAKKLLTSALKKDKVRRYDRERYADYLVHTGENKKARQLYRKLFEKTPNNKRLRRKISKLEGGNPLDNFKKVSGPQEGAAIALYDMARILYRDFSDESARVFAHLSMHLDSSLVRTKILLARIASRNDRHEEAIKHYSNIPENHEFYSESKLSVARLLEENEHYEEALSQLENLYNDQFEVTALIRKGDIYRRMENFPKAIESYNRAADTLGEEIPAEYWHLLYGRGMAYERNNQWVQAEKDLLAALKHKPDDPYILNYLGYAWADRGINLKRSLDMLERAQTLKSTDGYITDSLGWVYYRLGNFKEALPYLEKATELVPYDAVINDHLGDVYWQLGRKMEARFQWRRAKNIGADENLVAKITEKLEKGLQEEEIIREAKSSELTDSSSNEKTF